MSYTFQRLMQLRKSQEALRIETLPVVAHRLEQLADAARGAGAR